MENICRKTAILILVSLLIVSCHSKTSRMKSVSSPASTKSLELMGFTIQAGAFAKVRNAVRLTETLKDCGLDATYFEAADRLVKVRFGNYSTE